MSTCMPLIDARIPISIVTVPSGTPDAASLVEGDGEGYAGSGDGGGAGSAVGLEDVAVEDDGALAEGLHIDD